MNDRNNRVLLIEDNAVDQEGFERLFQEERFEADYDVAGSVSEAREVLNAGNYDVVISDYAFEDGTVFDVLESTDYTPIIVVTAGGNEGIAVRAMKAGAYDYVIKDPELNYLNVLPATIENAVKQKHSEERLQLLESAVASANDAIIILEAEPVEMLGRRILYVNKAFTEMTGYSYEEATSRTLKMLRGPKTNLSTLDKIRIALEERMPVRVELINYRKDRSEFWVECNIVPFADDKGSFTHWVSVQRDITKRKKAEEERERLLKEIESINAELTELNHELETIGAERTMSLMALTVADRIRNPAAMIGARCRRVLARQGIEQNLRENLQYILEGAENLDRIVKDFEAFLKSRQSLFHREDLNRIVQSVALVGEKEAACKGAELIVNTSSDPLRINMQKDLLRVAIFNIIKNAIEAISEGGTVKVETGKDGDSVILTVTDTGYGIPEHDIHNVFRPFFSTKERGFGLGLPLVKQIINEHLGEVIISSKPGQGSSFLVKFPIRWKEDNLY